MTLICSCCFLQVDGATNPKIQSIHLERFPIHKAQFSLDGEAVIATGLRNKMFYLYDMMEGRVTAVNGVRGERSGRPRAGRGSELSCSPPLSLQG